MCVCVLLCVLLFCLFFQAEDGIRDLVRSRGLGDVYKRQSIACVIMGNLEYRRENMATRTPKLILKQCDAEILHEAIKGHEHLARKLNVTVPENYTEFGVEALRYALDKLSESEDEKGWWTYFPIHQQDNKLIGSGGYKRVTTQERTAGNGHRNTPEKTQTGRANEKYRGTV